MCFPAQDLLVGPLRTSTRRSKGIDHRGHGSYLKCRHRPNWQIGKFIGSYDYTAKGHQYQAAGGRPVFCFLGGLSRSSWFFLSSFSVGRWASCLFRRAYRRRPRRRVHNPGQTIVLPAVAGSAYCVYPGGARVELMSRSCDFTAHMCTGIIQEQRGRRLATPRRTNTFDDASDDGDDGPSTTTSHGCTDDKRPATPGTYAD